MRNLFLVLLIFIQPAIVSAQTKADYEHAMSNFQKFYNAGQYDSVKNMFDGDEEDNRRMGITLKYFMYEYGKMISYKYIGIDTSDGSHVFSTKWIKGGNKTSSFTIDKENKFRVWRMIRGAPAPGQLLKNDQ